MIITNAAVKNRSTILVLIALIIIGGAWSYNSLPREARPDVAIPIVLITTVYEGVSPEDVETSVTIKIENELAGLRDVKEIRSTSAEGVSTIVIEFEPNIVVEDALQFVRDRLDLARPELPREAEEPAIREINISDFPVIIVSISGEISLVRLKTIADRLEDLIELVPGVLDVTIVGELEREIRLEVDPARLTAYDLTMAELLQLIPAENVNVSAGPIDTEGMRFNVRVPAEFIDPAEVDKLLLAVRDNVPIYLSDVATVADTFKDRSTYSRLNGVESITVNIQKRAGADIIPISNRVKAIINEVNKQVPAGVKLEIINDESRYVRMIVSDLENNLLSGMILVIVVLMIFMGLRSSLIVALAIPMSMLMTFAVILALGHTLNMVMLFSLVLALGMLVDNAIVIVENIYRHMEMGMSRFDASIAGTTEVAWPVITSTLTTLAAFAPLLFWPGIMGEFMKYLPIGVISALSSSLFVALIINPTVCSMAAKSANGRSEKQNRAIEKYRVLLRAALRNSGVTILLVTLLLVCVIVLYAKLGRGVDFFPEHDPERAAVNLRLPQGSNITETNRLTKKVEARVQPFLDKNELEYVVANVGSGGTGQLFGGAGGSHIANVTLVFPEFADRPRPSPEVLADIRASLTDIAGAEVRIDREEAGPPSGDAVSVEIAGEDFGILTQLSGQIQRKIEGVPGLVNLRSDFEDARPELVFLVDRQRAMILGVNTAIIGQFLQTAIFGQKVGIYRQFNDEYDITVRLPLAERIKIEDIYSLRVPNQSGQSVPISSLGRFDYRGGLGTIYRVNQRRVITLSGDAEGRLPNDVLNDVIARLSDMSLPVGYTINYAGEREEQEKAQKFLGRAFIIAVLLITMILVAQFNSFRIPIIIMTTVLLSLTGVMAGLLLTYQPFIIIMTGIGIISLAGVVVNNAIVLLAYIRQLEKKGMDTVEAAVEAGAVRLRPVLLTAITTILGLFPLAIGVSFNFRTMRLEVGGLSTQLWTFMASAVIFGLAFATVLTLVIVPSLYVAIARLGKKLRIFTANGNSG